MEFEVTNEEPIPVSFASGGRRKYPFSTMMVGDGFNVLDAETRQRAMNAAGVHCRTKGGEGKLFKSAKRPNGYRIWRIK